MAFAIIEVDTWAEGGPGSLDVPLASLAAPTHKN